MGRTGEVDAFVSALREASPESPLVNPYSTVEAARNLRRFLLACDPRPLRLLLVGESPGYRGALLSGVPLCSLSTLLRPKADPWNAFGESQGYEAPVDAPFWHEATATIVWSSLAVVGKGWPLPITWNALPFHVNHNGRNGVVRKDDLTIGRPWLESILHLFPNSVAVALGVRASEALDALGIEHFSVRHPSRGGKQQFVDGMAKVVSRVYECSPHETAI